MYQNKLGTGYKELDMNQEQARMCQNKLGTGYKELDMSQEQYVLELNEVEYYFIRNTWPPDMKNVTNI